MALVNDVKYSGNFHQLKRFIDENKPKKSDFFSSCGLKPFDTSLEALRSPQNIEDNEKGKVGILSETYIYVLIAQYCNKKSDLFESIVRNFRIQFDDICSIDGFGALNGYRPLFDKHVDLVWKFICGENISELEVIQSIYLLGRIYSIGLVEDISQLKDAINNVFCASCGLNIVKEVKALGNIFRESFIEEGVIKKDSDVILHPTFGDWSEYLGAYADIYIDGVIFDIKSNANVAYRGDMVGQVYGYYLAYLLDKKFRCKKIYSTLSDEQSKILKLFEIEGKEEKRCDSSLLNKEVHSIAIYFSRFGDIEMCNLERCERTLNDEQLSHIGNIALNRWNSRWNTNELLASYRKIVLEER